MELVKWSWSSGIGRVELVPDMAMAESNFQFMPGMAMIDRVFNRVKLMETRRDEICGVSLCLWSLLRFGEW